MPALSGLGGKTSQRRLPSGRQRSGNTGLEGVAGADAGVWERTRNAHSGEQPSLAEVWVHEGRNNKRNLRADHVWLLVPGEGALPYLLGHEFLSRVVNLQSSVWMQL